MDYLFTGELITSIFITYGWQVMWSWVVNGSDMLTTFMASRMHSRDFYSLGSENLSRDMGYSLPE